MRDQTSLGPSLAVEIVHQIEAVITEAEVENKPLEVDPYRGRVFELFVTAEAAGYVEDGSDPDLTADGICHTLAGRWDLADATRDSIEQQTKLSADQLAKMRMLWSVMRMWMEWTYAWKRWPEFHEQSSEMERDKGK